MTRRHMLAMLAGAAAAAPAVTELRVMGSSAQSGHVPQWYRPSPSASDLRNVRQFYGPSIVEAYTVIMHPHTMRDIVGQKIGPKKLRGGPKK